MLTRSSWSFSGLKVFFGGLEGLIGAPTPRLLDAICREHTMMADSLAEFVTPNYGVTTTSLIEYHFVAQPEAGLGSLGLDAAC